MAEITILDRERRLRAWFTRGADPLRRVVDSLDIGWGGVQRWATARMPAVTGWHLDVACGYATFLAQLGWRFPAARLVGLNVDFAGPHALARPLLAEAGVAATLVQADARCLPFVSGSFDSVSCFLGLQDIEIGFGQKGVQQAVAETARVLRKGGALVLLDEFPFERFDLLLQGLPLAVIDRAQRALDICWEREVAERAIALYAEGRAAQVRLDDESAGEQARRDAHRRMAADMERQLAERGIYVPFSPVRMVVAEGAVRGVQAEGAVCVAQVVFGQKPEKGGSR
jgi:ubiquinone/menaquinone biosynthesis C-methylase UbiE